MKLERKQVLDIYGVMRQLSGDKISPRGAYNIAKCRSLAEVEVNVVNEARKEAKQPEGMLAFEEKRLKLCEELAEKDEEGNAKKFEVPSQTGEKQEMFDITPENRKVLEEKLEELAEGEFKEVFEERDKIEQGFADLLSEEIDMSFPKIKLDDLPQKISAEQILALEPLLEVEE